MVTGACLSWRFRLYQKDPVFDHSWHVLRALCVFVCGVVVLLVVFVVVLLVLLVLVLVLVAAVVVVA